MRGGGERCRWLMASIAAIMALGAVCAALTWPLIFDSVLAAQLSLYPGSRSFREWSSPPPLYFKIHLFNWTNADKFPAETPHVVQLGPYSFRESRRRVNVTFHPHNNSVSYRTQLLYQFDAEASNGTLDDNITTLNPLAASAVYRARYDGYLKQKTLAMGLAVFGQHISVSKAARQLMFEGYEDLMLDFAKSLPPSATGGAPNIDKFGWFFQRNNSIDSDGYMQVTTGAAGGTLPGQILKWNYEDHLPFYNGQCSQLQGSVGEFLPRNLTEKSRLVMFLADLCRTVHMDYAWSGEREGLQYHRYAVGEKSFDNANECFCNGPCSWDGVMNVSACRYGSPMFVTLPHFLHGDPELTQLVTGLEPNDEKHSFYFAAEPKLGIPVDVAARFQLNIFIEPSPNIALFENAPRMLFPILWVEQRVQVNESVLSELRYVRTILDWGGLSCAGFALFLASIVALVTCTNICLKKPKYTPPVDNIIYDKPKDESELKLNPM